MTIRNCSVIKQYSARNFNISQMITLWYSQGEIIKETILIWERKICNCCIWYLATCPDDWVTHLRELFHHMAFGRAVIYDIPRSSSSKFNFWSCSYPSQYWWVVVFFSVSAGNNDYLWHILLTQYPFCLLTRSYYCYL